MDGVITMTMPYHVRAWSRVFAGEGIHVPSSEVYAREGQKGIVSVFEIFAQHGKPVTAVRARELLRKKEVIFKRIVRTRFVPGARFFVRKYHGRGVCLALVTGTARHELEKVLPPDMISRFDVIVTGSDVKNGKPHPEPYQRALKALKVSGGGALVVENAPFGITSAVKAGLVCVALETSLPRAYLKEADKVVADYHGLEKFIKEHYIL
jgi:beta-phosphoglucomutase